MIGIIGAMDSETKGIKNLIQNKKIKIVSQIEYVSGTLNGKDVVCAMCNPGKVNSAVCAQTMILDYNPEIIILSFGLPSVSPFRQTTVSAPITISFSPHLLYTSRALASEFSRTSEYTLSLWVSSSAREGITL